MGARQSKRSVDITTSPKKEGAAVEGVVAGSEAVEKIANLANVAEEGAPLAVDLKPTSNGVAPHVEPAAAAIVTPVQEKDKDEVTEKDKESEKAEETPVVNEEVKVETPVVEAPAENAATPDATLNESATEATSPSEPTSPTSPVDTPNTKEAKKKDKKKKWSFRSISFSRKDKSRPKDNQAKNEEVTKEEPLVEGAEAAEAAAAATTPTSPDESSPVAEESKPAEAEKKEDKEEEVAKPAPVAPAEAEKEPVPEAPAVAPPSPVAAKKVEEPVKEQNGIPEAKKGPTAMSNGYKEDMAPPPAITTDAPLQPPAITEDVASVTKAIEEIDIHEKAVMASAVSELESSLNEIVADGNFQRNNHE